MKYNVGDKVLIKSLDWYNKNKDEDGDVPCGDYDFVSHMSVFCGKILTIDVDFEDESYLMKEDTNGFVFTNEMIEGLVEEEFDLIPKFGEYSDNEPLDVPTMTTDFVKEHGLPCPEGYIFKDENGNIINATKIVLEKKKKEYPKTYEECCEIISSDPKFYVDTHLYSGILGTLYKLLVCRDAYWKIAEEEMGLGKPWKPDWEDVKSRKYVIVRGEKGKIIKGDTTSYAKAFAFPTEEMRDAFKENFNKELEICKELL